MARFDRPPLSTQDRTVVLPLPRPVGYLGEEEYELALSFEGAPPSPPPPALPTHCYRLALACARVSSLRARGACDAGERHQTLWLPVLPPAHRLERAAQHPQLLYVTLVRRSVLSLGVFWQSVCVSRRHPLCSQPQARRPRVCRLRTVFR